jgi:hypothetical protein
MKKILFLLMVLMTGGFGIFNPLNEEAYATTYQNVGVHCATGGNGSQSCTYTYTFFFFQQEHAVSCNTGYFACCNHDGARCYKNPI